VPAYFVPDEPVNEQVAVAPVPAPFAVSGDTVTGPAGVGLGAHVIEPVGTGSPLLPDTVAVYEYVVPVTLPVTDRFGTSTVCWANAFP
jgi:hypothetical protein